MVDELVFNSILLASEIAFSRIAKILQKFAQVREVLQGFATLAVRHSRHIEALIQDPVISTYA
jgi:hypothetical protein